MAFELPPLPYADDALEPDYSARTISFHYGKHHKTYVDTLNKLVAGTDLADKSLEDVIVAVAGKPDKQPVFNNAAQVWNHTFFWNCMKPGGGGAPTRRLGREDRRPCGSYEKFVEDFKAAAVGRFGSGWAWLVSTTVTLKIVSTPNAEMPAAPGVTPLLMVDVWEHAYYLDYQNLRPGLRADVPRQARQLGLRRREPREREVGGPGTHAAPEYRARRVQKPEGRRGREPPPALVAYGSVGARARLPGPPAPRRPGPNSALEPRRRLAVAAEQLAVARVAAARDRAAPRRRPGPRSRARACGCSRGSGSRPACGANSAKPSAMRRRVGVVHAEAADARRVDHADAAGQLVQARRRRRVAAAAVAGAHRAGLGRGLPVQGVQQRRLADAALADEDARVRRRARRGPLLMPSPREALHV